MKKLIVILTVLMSCNSAAFCSTTKDKKTKDKDKNATEVVKIKGKYDKQGGFRFGFTLNSGLTSLNDLENADAHLALNSDFGIVVDKFIGSKSWALNSGISYSAYKASYTVKDVNEEVANVNTRYDIKGNNLNIPLNLKYRSDVVGQRSKFYALAGANMVIAIGKGKQMETPVGTTGVVLSQGKVTGTEKASNYVAANVGAGMEFNTRGLRTIGVGMQYQKGFSAKNETVATSRDNISVNIDFFF